MALACGGSKPKPEEAKAAPVDAGLLETKDAEPEPPVEKPFAKTGAEATSLVNAAVESKTKEIQRCVDEYRARKQDKWAKLHVVLGVDQEGTLIAVTIPPKSPDGDKAASDCIWAALKRAPFPKSRAGVITVNKVFDFEAVYPK